MVSLLAGELASRKTSANLGITLSMSISSIIMLDKIGTKNLSVPLDFLTFDH